MVNNKVSAFRIATVMGSFAALLIPPGCSVNVKKEPNGQDKQVDINTVIGGIHVSKGADASDV